MLCLVRKLLVPCVVGCWDVEIIDINPSSTCHYCLGIVHFYQSHGRAQDIFIHSGDVAKVGSDGELGDFNHWLGTIKHKYQHMLIISGSLVGCGRQASSS